MERVGGEERDRGEGGRGGKWLGDRGRGEREEGTEGGEERMKEGEIYV